MPYFYHQIHLGKIFKLYFSKIHIICLHWNQVLDWSIFTNFTNEHSDVIHCLWHNMIIKFLMFICYSCFTKYFFIFLWFCLITVNRTVSPRSKWWEDYFMGRVRSNVCKLYLFLLCLIFMLFLSAKLSLSESQMSRWCIYSSQTIETYNIWATTMPTQRSLWPREVIEPQTFSQ